jgi:hypothetical protein
MVESVVYLAIYFVYALNNSNLGIGIFRIYELDVDTLSSFTIKIILSNV